MSGEDDGKQDSRPRLRGLERRSRACRRRTPRRKSDNRRPPVAVTAAPEIAPAPGRRHRPGSDTPAILEETARILAEITLSATEVTTVLRGAAVAGEQAPSESGEIHEVIARLEALTRQQVVLLQQAAAVADTVHASSRELQRLLSKTGIADDPDKPV